MYHEEKHIANTQGDDALLIAEEFLHRNSLMIFAHLYETCLAVHPQSDTGVHCYKMKIRFRQSGKGTYTYTRSICYIHWDAPVMATVARQKTYTVT